jgi:nucleoid-associated protein YgaU|tara:strand:- start:2144 stop:2440 length:297 start_codon:yes stop_codon:yes gene_type:complete
MNRYEDITIVKTEEGKRYQKSVQYPLMERKLTDIYIIGARHDRLDNLAFKYYEDARLWWIIARANNIGKGNLTVPIGAQLRIPQDYLQIIQEYNILNE